MTDIETVPPQYSTTRSRLQGGNCPKCGYHLSKFRIDSRCFNCDYAERGSDGPWNEVSDQVAIWTARDHWNCSSIPFAHEDAFKIESVINYLKQRRVFDLAANCDQLRASYLLNRVLKLPAYGDMLVGRVWHVRKGFIGVHVTRITRNYGAKYEYEREDRRTAGSCQGGGVWFGQVTPDSELIVGEGIETTLSAMILWGASAGCATLGSAGLEALVLPSAARQVVIAADNDIPEKDNKTGKEKRIGKGLRSARIAKRCWLESIPSIDVEIKMPPKPGSDWNDVLMEQSNG